MRGLTTHPIFRIPKISLEFFFLGVASGFIAALIIPEIGIANYSFQLAQAEQLKIHMEKWGDVWLTVLIYARNYSMALVVSNLPLILIRHAIAYRRRRPFESGDFNLRLKSEIHLVLTMYSVTVLFAYGFSTFGLFLAHIYAEDSFSGLIWWSSYLVPHGILETLGMISATSTGIVIRDSWLRNFNCASPPSLKQIAGRGYAAYLLSLSMVFLLSAFLEVHVSSRFAELAWRIIESYASTVTC